MRAGLTNFNYLTKSKTMPTELTLQNAAASLRPNGPPKPINYFTIYKDDDNYKGEYVMMAHKAYDGTLSYSLSVLTSPDGKTPPDKNNPAHWKPIQDLQNFNSPEVLRGSLANLLINPKKERLVKATYRNADKEWMLTNPWHNRVSGKQ